MRNVTFKIVFLMIFFACNPSRHASNISPSLLKIHLNSKGTIKSGESLQIEVENISADEILIYYPEKLLIEKAEENKWRKLRILECLCDIPCQPSPDKLKLAQGESIKLNWDQKETWCGPKVNGQIRKTLSKLVGAGEYRIVIKYKTSGGQESLFTRSFKILS